VCFFLLPVPVDLAGFSALDLAGFTNFLPACSRRHGTWLEEKNIEIPGGVITGPDLSLENKDLIALVTVNNFDKVRHKHIQMVRFIFMIASSPVISCLNQLETHPL
jgi:hypothetical protein